MQAPEAAAETVAAAAASSHGTGSSLRNIRNGLGFVNSRFRSICAPNFKVTGHEQEVASRKSHIREHRWRIFEPPGYRSC